MTVGRDLLVGRGRQLAALDDVLARAREERGELVALIGDAGIGKSALVDAFARRAAGAGCAVVAGRAWEMSDAPAWFPVWPALATLGLPVPPRPQEDGGVLLWQRVLAALTVAAAERPQVWVLEDVHLADLPTLQLLRFLAASIGPLRVAIAVTLRPPHPGDGGATRTLVELVRGARTIELGPLSADEVADVARRIVDRPLTAEALQELHDRTGGNPLFVTECARAMCLPRPLDRIPPTVQHVARDRVSALPPRCQALLRDASVLGHDVSEPAPRPRVSTSG